MDIKAYFKSKCHKLRCVTLFTSAKNEPAEDIKKRQDSER